MRKKSILLLPFLIFGMALAGCKGKKNPPIEPEDVAVETVTVSPKSVSLKEGETKALSVTVLPENATDPSVVWTTNAAAVATVSSSGLVTAVKEGKAVITVASGIISDTCEVTVTKAAAPTVTGIEVTYTGGDVEVGHSIDASKITVKKVMSDGTKPELSEAEYATIKIYQDEALEHEIPATYVFVEADIGDKTAYVKFDTFKASFSFKVKAVTPPAPTEPDNYVIVGDSTTKVELTLNAGATMAQDQTAEYKADLANLVADAELHIYFNKTAITKYGPNPDDTTNHIKNNATGTDTDGYIKVVQAAASATLYVDVYNDGGYSYWLTGGPEIPQGPAAGYYLVGNAAFVGENKTEWSVATGKIMDDDLTDGNLAQEAGVAVAKDSEIKILNYVDGEHDAWLGYDALEGAHPFAVEGVSTGENPQPNGNIKFTKGGTFNFFVNSQGKIYISDVTVINYSVQVGTGDKVAMTAAEKDNIAHELGNYKATVPAIAAETEIKFFADDTQVNTHIGANAGSNSVVTTNENVVTIKVHNATTVETDIYFKTYDNETESERDGQVHSYSFWIAGLVLPTVTFTVTNYPAASKSAEHYGLHAWGGAAAAATYTATLEGTTLTAEVPDDITHFLVAAWDGEFDWDSLVYKSADIDVVENQTSYALPDESGTQTLTITNYPATQKPAEHYGVHAWGGADAATTYTATLEGTTLTAEVPNDITGFLVAAWNGDFAWNSLIYQSNDITIEENKTSYALPDFTNEITLKVYVKADSDITWWLDNDPFIVAEIVIGSDTVFAEAVYSATYDSNKTLYYTITIESETLPNTIKLYRCDPSVVTSVPTVAPTSGVWNTTNAGTVGGSIANNYTDVNIA